MSKQQANQASPAALQLPPAEFQPLLVKAISIAMQAEIWLAQAINAAITEIVEALQTANKANAVFFTEEGILYCQVKDQQQLVSPASLVDRTLHQFQSAKIMNHQESNHTDSDKKSFLVAPYGRSQWIKTCKICQLTSPCSLPRPSLLLIKPTHPFNCSHKYHQNFLVR
uniref:GAF domain-containing protein n=1 Tax=Romanomermis culicivorax TaxID=13658 RepID=A0A915L2F3_ROMCU